MTPLSRDPERIKKALTKCKGNISQAAKALDVTRGWLHTLINQYPECLEIVEDARQELVDLAELKMHQFVLEGQPWAVSLTLTHLGKNRGWTKEKEEKKESLETLLDLLPPELAEPIRGYIARKIAEASAQ
jgi:hypothetical protein